MKPAAPVTDKIVGKSTRLFVGRRNRRDPGCDERREKCEAGNPPDDGEMLHPMLLGHHRPSRAAQKSTGLSTGLTSNAAGIVPFLYHCIEERCIKSTLLVHAVELGEEVLGVFFGLVDVDEAADGTVVGLYDIALDGRGRAFALEVDVGRTV